MSTLTNLPPDQIISILNELPWRDIYNLCKTTRTICQHPRIQEFIKQRADETAENLLNQLPMSTTRVPHLIPIHSLNSYKKFYISSATLGHFRRMLQDFGLSDDDTTLIYWLKEEDTRKSNLFNSAIAPIVSSLPNPITHHASTNVMVHLKREDIKKILVYLLLNGEIDGTISR